MMVLVVGPRAARGSCSWDRWHASMDYACAGSRGARSLSVSLPPKKIDQAQRFGPRTFKRPGPGLSFGSRRGGHGRDAVRGPLNEQGLTRRAAVSVSRSVDTTADSEAGAGTLDRLTRPPAPSPRRPP